MAHPFPLFESIWTPSREIAVTPEVTEALRNGAAVAIGVSGGKDSAATAFATVDYLNEMDIRVRACSSTAIWDVRSGASHSPFARNWRPTWDWN